jgi:hypothetical protein
MFRHTQFSNVSDLPEKKRQRLQGSWAEEFYRDFFSRIDEGTFAVMYVDFPSRPNVPINWLVGLETLKAGFGWSDEELYDHFCFDLQIRYALGIHDLNESDFDLRILYYFRERLSHYNLEHGVNLLTKAFEHITDQQVTTLQVKTGKQRMDSTQIASNIMKMSRLQLLVEALQRMHRSLSEGDQQHYGPGSVATAQRMGNPDSGQSPARHRSHRYHRQVRVACGAVSVPIPHAISAGSICDAGLSRLLLLPAGDFSLLALSLSCSAYALCANTSGVHSHSSGLFRTSLPR